MDNDTNRQVMIFREEAIGCLERVNTALVRLEESPGEKEPLMQISRELHTLKGTAALVGMDPIGHIAHILEDAILLTSKQGVLFEGEVLDSIFFGLDAIRSLLEHADSQEEAIDVKGTINTIETLITRVLEGGGGKGETQPASSEGKGDTPLLQHKAAAPFFYEKADEVILLASELALECSTGRQRIDELVKCYDGLCRLEKELGELPQIDAQGPDSGGEQMWNATMRQAKVHTARVKIAELRSELFQTLQRFSEHDYVLTPLAEGLSLKARELRLVPTMTVLTGFPRLVRDLCRREGKRAQLIIEGARPCVDRESLGLIREILVHMVKNAIAHGIEEKNERIKDGKSPEGIIAIALEQAGYEVNISVKDDGKGIDIDQIRKKIVRQLGRTPEEVARLSDQEIAEYIFQPAFSLKEKSDEVAGRGIGLDVVKKNVELLGGRIAVHTQQGQGTKITVALPLKTSSRKVLLIGDGGMVFGLPLSQVKGTTLLPKAGIAQEGNFSFITANERRLYVQRLSSILGGILSAAKAMYRGIEYVIEVSGDSRDFGLIAGEIFGVEEVIIKQQADIVNNIPYVESVAIDSQGDIVFLLDVSALSECIVNKKMRKKETKEGL
ncbi:MAG: Hpt domain-containing protein [Candidatus Omnitrophica bacterium]|nr:Hpt domain-containing protein [Candidatus Omnitrophota bacterium]